MLPDHRISTRVLFLSLLGAVASAACTPAGEVTVVMHGGTAPLASMAHFVPLDPTPYLPRRLPPPPPHIAESLAVLATLQDSTATLDQRFQSARDSLNSEADVLAGMDRRTSEYAERYDEFRPRITAAESLRAARDRLGARAAALREALSAHLPAEDDPTVQQALDALQRPDPSGRRPVAREMSRERITVALAPGEWWVGISAANDIPAEFHAIRVTRGGRDTVTIRRNGD